jgi:uncharacterized protein (DUF58 family)
MWKRIIAYMSFFLVTGYLFVMYDSSVLSAALILEVLYPFVSYALLCRTGRKVETELKKVQDMGEKKQNIQLDLEINNRSVIWNINYELFFLISQSGFYQKQRKRIYGTIAPRESRLLNFFVSADYCGKMEVCLDKIRLYDFLGLFYRTRFIKEKRTIAIFPQVEPIQLEITRRTREFRADADVYSGEREGDDSTEIYQIREWRTWDSVHHIHWKMTAKEDKLMVKEYGFPLGCPILIWMDFSAGNHKVRGFEYMLEKVAGLSVTLLLDNCLHMVSWFDEENERVEKRKVCSEEDMYELLYHMLELKPYKNKALMRAFYEKAFQGFYFSSIVTINGDGEVLVNGEKQEILQL